MKQAELVEYLEIGGWRVARMRLPKGASYHALVTGARTRADVGYVAVWIKGRIEGINLSTAEALVPREPWMVSSDLPEMSVGRLSFKAAEDSEWLCFDAKLNAGRVPELCIVEGVAPAQPLDRLSGHIEHPLAPGVFVITPIRSF